MSGRQPLVVVAGAGILALTLPLAAILLASTVLVAELGGPKSPSSTGSAPGAAVPATWQLVESEATSSCPGLGWELLGALGFISTGSGRWPGRVPPWWPWPGGLFGVELPGAASLAEDASRAVTSICSTERLAGSLPAALIALTGRATYALDAEVLATALRADPGLDAGHAQAVLFAAGALGLPYRWGGNGPDSYDCSGLVVAAWRSAGLSFPRTAQEQFDATSRGLGNPGPGDLVFFGQDQRSIEHVGIEIGLGLMIDAPYTGALVRIDPDGLSAAAGVGVVG